ncbi:hypothetical protein [Haloarcula japonica]|uniref:hypothetical protein n=1 Tax=Haloarcula japonica TaxID=29282 RepID=UPI001267DCC7|nr:hypothetical protein [Haloarcula japonica]
MRERGPAGPGETGLSGWWVATARDATDRLPLVVCRALVRCRSRGRRNAPLGAIARLAAVHRACGSGRDPGLPPEGEREPLFPMGGSAFVLTNTVGAVWGAVG